MNPYRTQAEDTARRLFFDNPSLSVDDAAREINNTCPRGLNKDAISRIRIEVRNRISGGAPAHVAALLKDAAMTSPHKPPTQSQGEPFNPIRGAGNPIHIKPTETQIEPSQMVKVATVQIKRADKPRRTPVPHVITPEIRGRMDFLLEAAMQDVTLSSRDAHDLLRKQFGVSVSGPQVAQVLTEARRVHGMGLTIAEIRKQKVEADRGGRTIAPLSKLAPTTPPPLTTSDVKDLARMVGAFMKARNMRTLLFEMKEGGLSYVAEYAKDESGNIEI